MITDADVVLLSRTIFVGGSEDVVVIVVVEVVLVVVVVVEVDVLAVVVVLGKVEGLILESFFLGSGSSIKITKDFPLFKFPCHINFILPCSEIQFE